ncbi:MAG: adenylate/guanylate cyclase domain-containing protein [bacterium]
MSEEQTEGTKEKQKEVRVVVVPVTGGDREYGRVVIGYELKPLLVREREKRVDVILNSLAQGAEKSMEEMDYSRVKDMIDQVAKSSPDIVGLLLYDELRNHIHGSAPFEGGKEIAELDLNNPLKMETVSEKGKEYIDGRLIVVSGGKPVGVVRVFYSLDSLKRAQRMQRRIAAFFILGFVAIGIFLSVATARRFSRPILKLAEIATRIGEGRLDETVNIKSGGDELEFLGNAFNQMIAGLKERDFVKDTFSRYVTKQVAEEILKDPDKIAPGGKKREVTVLFSDIRGFTAYSEGHNPEEVISHLNEYLSAMVDVIFKYEGTLDKFIGDAIMAVFGSPLPHDDDPLRAVKTALEMQARLNELNEKWKKEEKLPLKIGIGVNTGEVIAGNIGDIRRMEYTVIGDNVNLASRIENLTKNYKCPIIISESTYEKVKNQVEVNKLEAATVEGKTHSVEIYELLGLKN